MTAYCDFVRQPSIDGDEGRLRPDLIVRMPGGKKVVVDAKVSLESYLDAHAADETEQRAMHLRAHARQVREHIRKLSARSYWSQFDEAPDFVVLFLPGEHFLNGALEAEPALIEEGVNQCVMLATPTTLITLLRAIAYGWQQEKVAEGARAVSEIGRELHARLVKLADHLQTVGKRLRGTVSAYNDAVGSLDGRVLPAARRFADHGAVSAGKELRDVDPVDLMPRTVQAPEVDEGDEEMRALLPATAPDADAA
jgi:DNA recombination protein RmuC